jgi:transcriptional regulator EpsA
MPPIAQIVPAVSPIVPAAADSAAAWNDVTSATSNPYELTAQERDRLLRIVSHSLSIKTHCDLYLWLNGEMRNFLPHQLLISAWGDYASCDFEVDVTSGLPGVRTAEVARCRVADVVSACHARWVDAGRKPLLFDAATAIVPHSSCACRVHRALRQMRSLLVHGVRDLRNGTETLFIALDTGSFFKGFSRERFLAFVHLLIDQLDVALRKVAVYPLKGAVAAEEQEGRWFGLSLRELETLELVCRGKTNLDIATALDISHFTVKNHVQRIFRKLGVSNRTEAAAKYHRALRESGARPNS